MGGTKIIPQVISFPANRRNRSDWSDISPRMGMAYDLFGNGKTAVKFNLGKYMEALSALNRQRPESAAAHCHHDDPVVERPRRARHQQRLRAAMRSREPRRERRMRADGEPESGDEHHYPDLGRQLHPRLGEAALQLGAGSDGSAAARAARVVDGRLLPALVRQLVYDRRTGLSRVGLHAVLPHGAARSAAAGRRRLPGRPDFRRRARQGRSGRSVSTWSSNFAEQTEHWNGFDINVTARSERFTAQGGTSTGAQVRGQLCAPGGVAGAWIRCSRFERGPRAELINGVSPTSPFCHYEEPFLTRASGLAACTDPEDGGPGERHVPEQPRAAAGGGHRNRRAGAWVVPNAIARQALGRDLSGGAANITVNIVQPGTVFSERVNQFDFRIAKILPVRPDTHPDHARPLQPHEREYAADLQPVYNPTGQWLTPTSVLTARFVKIGAQFDF